MSDTEITTPSIPEQAAAEAQPSPFRRFRPVAEHPARPERARLRAPTPIQAQAIPVLLQGRDVMGAAQTGTGKTASFSLPIIQMLLRGASTSPARHPVRALILAPTRELAVQVAEKRQGLLQAHAAARHRSVRRHGHEAADRDPEGRRGNRHRHPGPPAGPREQKNISLSQVQMLVMDEADRMLDMGFLPDLQRIINLLPKKRQNLMFSATFSPEIKKLANTFLNDPVTIEVARANKTADTVTQVVQDRREPEARADRAPAAPARAEAGDRLLQYQAGRLAPGARAGARRHEGGRHPRRPSQQERMAALDAFKKNEIDILVATDVAARGLDISDLPCVINYDLPYNAEDYVHRIGTGRGRLGRRHFAVLGQGRAPAGRHRKTDQANHQAR
jgi:superfamily II DNA/RNA helicase